ncbi:hypothetical protein [Calothrix sp. NIES-2100]
MTYPDDDFAPGSSRASFRVKLQVERAELVDDAVVCVHSSGLLAG